MAPQPRAFFACFSRDVYWGLGAGHADEARMANRRPAQPRATRNNVAPWQSLAGALPIGAIVPIDRVKAHETAPPRPCQDCRCPPTRAEGWRRRRIPPKLPCWQAPSGNLDLFTIARGTRPAHFRPGVSLCPGFTFCPPFSTFSLSFLSPNRASGSCESQHKPA